MAYKLSPEYITTQNSPKEKLSKYIAIIFKISDSDLQVVNDDDHIEIELGAGSIQDENLLLDE